jgi:hypothetical protein
MTTTELKQLLRDMKISQLELTEILNQNKFTAHKKQPYSTWFIYRTINGDILTERFRNHVRVALQQYVDLLQKFANEA